MSTESRDVIIGKVGATFGRKGEVKVWPYIDDPDEFSTLKKVRLSVGPGVTLELGVSKVWFHKGAIIVKFDGINDMSAAETLRDAEVHVDEIHLAPLAKDQYYIDDLLGLDVVTTEGESLGKITEVLKSPANDVYVTDRAMIPAVKEFVVEINIGDRKMVVRAVEGLVQE